MNRAKLMIYTKEFFKYLCVWILFGIAIILSAWVNIPRLHIDCNFSLAVCNALNNVILTLSLSYIAGFIFFFLSEFVPTSNRKYDDYLRITHYLNNLMIDYNGLMNFSDNSENYQRLPFAELSQSLFQEDVSRYCSDLKLSKDNGECDLYVHFKADSMLFIEMNANRVREDVNILQMLSYKLPYNVAELVGRIKCCRYLSEIEQRRGFRGDFDIEDLKIRFALYKEMMIEYYTLEKELIDIVNKNNRHFSQYKIWQIII